MLAVGLSPASIAFAAFVIAAVAAGVAALAWRRRDQVAAVPLAVVLVLDAVWLVTDGLRLLSQDLSGALFWFSLQQVIIAFVPVAWLLFVFEYVGREELVRPRVVTALVAMPLVMSVLTMTNGVHGLVLSDPAFVTSGELTVLAVSYEPAYWVSAAYVYALMLVGFALLGRLVVQTRSVYRRQVALVLLASAIPGAAGVLYATGRGPVPVLDLTPYSVLLEGVIIFYAIFRHRFLDLEPIARATVIENMGDAMFVVDAEWTVVDVNPAARELVDDDDPLDRPLGTVLPGLREHDGDPVAETLVLGRGRSPDRSVAPSENGGDLYFDVNVTDIEDHRGDVSGRLVVLNNVTEREHRERTLEAIQDTSSDLIGAETVEAVCDRTVTAMREILGLPYVCVHLLRDGVLEPVACTGRTTELSDPVPSFEVGEGLQGTVYETGESRVYEDVRTDDAPLLDPETSVRSAVLFPLGEHGVLAAGSDERVRLDESFVSFAEILASNATVALTRAERERQLREREGELERQNERLDEFASVISHDLRNPITVAQGSLEFARDGDEAAFDRLGRAVDRMEQLTEDLLALARRGDEHYDIERIPLADAVRDAWATVETGDARLLVSTDVTVEADPSQLRQLLENCFRNAVEHGSTSPGSTASRQDAAGVSSGEPSVADAPEDAVEHSSTSPRSTPSREDAGEQSSPSSQRADGPVDGRGSGRADGLEGAPTVTVRVGSIPDGFYVEDDGPGIPEDEREQVFDRGYSGGQGTGLGLSIVEQIARAHGWVVSATEGKLRAGRGDGSDVPTDRSGGSGGARFEFLGVTVSGD